MTLRDHIITLLKECGFFYIECQLLCYLETFVGELVTRRTLSLEQISLSLGQWLRVIMSVAKAAQCDKAPVFLHLVEHDDEVYFTALTQDAYPLCTFSGDSLVEKIAMTLLITPSIPGA